ncbi:MAG: UbiA family prenyltransferase [Salinarimonadaceae bacterium]|nr:MAG: UbiA family prenyltransferase [Salinarimonadaceae bacterium]
MNKVILRAQREELPDQGAAPPLVLDVDGVVLRTDLLHETAIAFLKANPFRIFLLLYWLLTGRAQLKRRLAQRAAINVDLLPLNEELVAFAQSAHDQGRVVVLATAADRLLAERLARRLGFIDVVIASDGETNLKGAAKADALVERFPDGFAYIGDSASDLHVWKRAEAIGIVGAGRSTQAAALALGKNVELTIARPAFGLKGWAKALRLHQWAKNVLVFAPLVLGGLIMESDAWLSAGLAFLALGVLASATYLLNDLWDLEDDRRHWTKRNRPLASGRMTIAQAASVIPVGIAGSLLIGALLGLEVVAVLAIYLTLTLGYSLHFKRKPVLDAFLLATLFTLRLVLGIVAVGVAPSPWLLVFSMFLFTSLSFAKRQTEVLRYAERTPDLTSKLAGRGYFIGDAPFILAMGVASGMASILIMVLYLTQDALHVDIYANAQWLWGIPPALFLWLSRIWMIGQRGELLDDPVVFAMKDPKSLALCGMVAASFLMALSGVPF